MGERYRQSSSAVPWGRPRGSMCRRPPPIWPDHDLSRLPVWRPRNRRLTKVQIILPISVRCDACRNSIDKGSEFSSRKKEVAVASVGEAYLGIPEFRFYFGCTGCSAELAINNDQWNSYCIVESGGTRFDGPDVPEVTDESEKMHCQPSGREE